MNDPDLTSDTENYLLWFFLIFAIPGLIMLSFWLSGYFGG